MKNQFELEWLGGASASLFRRRRSAIDELPWGTFTHGDYEPDSILEARRVWTNSTFTEYASAAAFSALTSALLECGAPIDLIACAADFVVDEMSHTEMVGRITMELGGATPFLADLDLVAPSLNAGLSPLLKAAELIVKVSSVGEALSVPILAENLKTADHPLVRGVISKLLHDEGPHSKIGDWFFEWAEELLSEQDRVHLAGVALETIKVYSPLWRFAHLEDGSDENKIGSISPLKYRQIMLETVRHKIVRPLSRHNIFLDESKLGDLLQ
jgi:hypothetical protein